MKALGGTSGGIIACASSSANYSNNINIDNCYVKNIESENSDRFGGIIGVTGACNGDRTITITSCNVENAINKDASAGGICGCITDTNSLTVKNCNVENINGFDSGIISNFLGKTAIVKDCSARNVTLDSSTTSNLGGIVGYGTNMDLENCFAENIQILRSDVYLFENVGGVIGFLRKGSIKSSKVQKFSLNENVAECTVMKIGGIVGFSDDVSVSNCQVSDATINVPQEAYYIGGICGFGTNIKDSNVTNLKINAPNVRGVGGIIGHGFNNVSTSLIQNCEVKNSSITGKEYVGGIAGAAFINIADCKVEDSEISGQDSIGGIQGFGGEFENSSKYVPVKIDNAEVKNTTVNGKTNSNKILGRTTYIKDSSTPTQDKITNCKYNDAAVSQ